jgi:hypothetical protein
MRTAIVEEARVRSNLVIAVGAKALHKSTGTCRFRGLRHTLECNVGRCCGSIRTTTKKQHAGSNHSDSSHEKSYSTRNARLLDHPVHDALVIATTTLHVHGSSIVVLRVGDDGGGCFRS